MIATKANDSTMYLDNSTYNSEDRILGNFAKKIQNHIYGIDPSLKLPSYITKQYEPQKRHVFIYDDSKNGISTFNVNLKDFPAQDLAVKAPGYAHPSTTVKFMKITIRSVHGVTLISCDKNLAGLANILSDKDEALARINLKQAVNEGNSTNLGKSLTMDPKSGNVFGVIADQNMYNEFKNGSIRPGNFLSLALNNFNKEGSNAIHVLFNSKDYRFKHVASDILIMGIIDELLTAMSYLTRRMDQRKAQREAEWAKKHPDEALDESLGGIE